MAFLTNSSNNKLLLKNVHRNLTRCQTLLLLLTLGAGSATTSQAKAGSASDNFLSSMPLSAAISSRVNATNPHNVAVNPLSAVVKAETTQPIPIGTYKIINVNSGKALDVFGRSMENKAVVHQYSYVSGGNQRWVIEPISNGTYKITAVHSGKALDVVGRSKNNGAAVQQYDYTGAINQQWRIEPAGNGYYKIISVNSNKVLEVKNMSTADRGTIQQNEYNGGSNQLWKIDSIVTPGLSGPPAGYELVFGDEFNGQAELDTSKWFTRLIEKGGYNDYLNNERQRYRENGNHVMTGSSVRLTAKVDASGGAEYTSGLIRSKTTFKYGYIEGRFKLPKGEGIFPAFWLRADANSDPELVWPPEIDIFEYENRATEKPNMIHSNVIDHGPQGKMILDRDPKFDVKWFYYKAPVDLSQDWHTIGMLWNTDNTVTTYLDGKMLVKRSTRWVDDKGVEKPNAHVIVNFALGPHKGTVDASKLPSFLDVDYIRVYQKSNAKNAGTSKLGQNLCPTKGC